MDQISNTPLPGSRAVDDERRRVAGTQAAVLDALPASIALIDSEGVILSVNQTWRSFAESEGLALSGHGVGANYIRVCQAAEGPEAEAGRHVAQGIQSVLAGESPQFSFEYRCDSPAQLRWFRLVVTPLRHQGLVGAVVAHVDVTPRKVSEEALRISEERFRLLSRATSEAVWDWDMLSGSVWWGEGFESLFGFTRSDLESTIESWRQLIHPQDRPRVERQLLKVIDDGGTDWSDEYRFQRLDSSYVHVADRGHVLRDAVGRPVRMIGGMTDLTEQRVAAEKLAEQAALLDQARDASLVCDLEGRVTYWSKSAERLYGSSAAQALGSTRVELATVDRTAFDQAYRTARTQGEWHGELVTENRSGEPLVVDSSWTLLRDAQGRPKSILMIDTDITERKRIEAQFLRAQRMDSVGTLAGGIAHDLNNALAPIVMSLAVLKLGEKDPKRQKLLGTLEAAAKRGGDMVRQVLSFARGVEGRRVEVSVERLLRDISAATNNTFLKAVDVRATIPQDLWPVSGDPMQLHQALLNLCVNAKDAMPNGGILSLSAENLTFDDDPRAVEPEAHPGRYVVIIVEDTGVGMTREVQDRIFDPFFTTKEPDRGTGLGLSTSLAIVKSHGGFIRVHSAPEQGSRFRIYLPAQVELGTEWDALAPENLPRGGGETIVVVDDEEAVLDVTQETLETFGYRVLVAADGPAAIALVAATPDVQAVITDMMMPVMDGAALILVLRRMNPHLRIVGASGLYVDEKIARAMEAGVDAFLSKPFTAPALLKTLHDLLRPRG